MAYDWGPHFIVPSDSLKTFSGTVLLRENYDGGQLRKELESLRLSGAVLRITNPWYYRRKNAESWIKIGESDDQQENFPVRWNTTKLEDGEYEILGMMHVIITKDNEERTIARQNIQLVTVEN